MGGSSSPHLAASTLGGVVQSSSFYIFTFIRHVPPCVLYHQYLHHNHTQPHTRTRHHHQKQRHSPIFCSCFYHRDSAAATRASAAFTNNLISPSDNRISIYENINSSSSSSSSSSGSYNHLYYRCPLCCSILLHVALLYQNYLNI